MSNTIIPNGWQSLPLSAVASPSTEKIEPSESNKARYVGLEHIEKNTGKLLGHAFSDEVRSTKSVFRQGDVLYGKLRPYLNKVWLADFDGVCSTDILVFPQSPQILSKFLQLRLLCADFVRFANMNSTGVNHPRTNFHFIGRFEILLPPVDEQKRIVDRVEAMFTQLDAGVAALERSRARIKRYRQAVLQAAVTGSLQNKQPLTHGEYDRKLLPSGWNTARLGEVASNIEYGYTDSANRECVGPKFLRITDIQDGQVDWDAVPYCNCDEDHLPKYRLKKGDIVFTRTGATTGKSYLIGDCPEAVFASYLIRVRVSEFVLPEYLYVYFQSPRYWEQIISERKGSAQPGVNAKILSDLEITIPPLEDQIAIVSWVEEKMSKVEAVETSISKSMRLAEHFRQSILSSAFSGKLL